MTWGQYQTLAQRTSSTHSSADKVMNGCLGLIGEAGEVADVVKKHLFQGAHGCNDKIKKEIGDVLWYCAQLFTGLGLNMDDVMATDDAQVIMKSTIWRNMIPSKAVYALARYAAQPYMCFVEQTPHSNEDMEYRIREVLKIIAMCKYILNEFVCINIEKCLQMNIDKLKARYPEGFDADRSNNRAPGDQ